MTGNNPIGTWLRVSAIAGAGLLFIQAARKRAPANLWLAGIATAMLGAGIAGGAIFQKSSGPEEDIVDLASELSFPASDPPAY